MSARQAEAVTPAGLEVWGACALQKVYGDDTRESVPPRPLALLAARGEVRHLQVALRAFTVEQNSAFDRTRGRQRDEERELQPFEHDVQVVTDPIADTDP